MTTEKLYNKWDLIKEVQQMRDSLTFKNFKLLQEIGKKAKQHKRICKEYCNNGDIKNYDSKISKVEAVIRHRIQSLNHSVTGETFNFTVEFQHDPRSSTVKIFYGEKPQIKETETIFAAQAQIFWVLQ